MEVIDTFIIAGHNNAKGWGMAPEDLPAELAGGVPNVLTWRNGQWKDLDADAVREQYGPDTSFAADMQKALDRPIGIILVTAPLTSLAEHWAPDTGDMWKELVDQVRNAADARPIVLRGFVWVNGLKDAMDEETADYEKRQRAFVQALRRDLAAPKLPFLTIQEPSSIPNAGELRRAQAAAANLPNCAVHDTDHIARPDQFHYTPQGYFQLGAELAQTLRPLLNP